ncbi:hypothetical protein MKW94_020444, partial [Papaver nudicaule]|nr:hypothetical protein [Papaver nudicaule]MCL7036598.1 hypothetical protein [Papaver nudicaule]
MLFASQGLRYRKLEVILTTSVENLGKAGETVKVAPGYFRNHLMAKMFDVPNIEKYAYLIREQRKSWKAVTTKACSDPSGNYQGWKAAAIGANNQAAHIRLEYKLLLQEGYFCCCFSVEGITTLFIFHSPGKEKVICWSIE